MNNNKGWKELGFVLGIGRGRANEDERMRYKSCICVLPHDTLIDKPETDFH